MEALKFFRRERGPLLSGVLLALSFPNILYPEIFWGGHLLAFFALLPLLASLQGIPAKAAFQKGYLCGLVFFLLSLYWINFIRPLELGAGPAWVALSAYLALFPACFAWAVALGWRRNLPFQALWIPALWTLLEGLREVALSGFPWVSLGSSQPLNQALLPLAAVTGIYGLHFAVVLGNLLLWAMWKRGVWGRREWAAAAAALLLLILLRNQAPGLRPAGPSLRCAVLQGNVNQDQDWTLSYRQALMANYFGMMEGSVKAGAQLIVWPESSFPGIFNRGGAEAEAVIAFAKSHQVAILLGSTWEREDGYANAAVLVDPEGRVSHYDKRHLVPFGEFIPFRSRIRLLDQVLTRMGFADFKEGPAQPALAWGPYQLAPLVCYESIYGDLGRKPGNGALAIITLDTWFGDSAAPRYHQVQSVFRAVESGRWIARAAATGVSCFVSPQGRIVSSQALNTRGWILQDIDCASVATPYQRFGPWFLWLCVFLIAILVLSTMRRQGKPG